MSHNPNRIIYYIPVLLIGIWVVILSTPVSSLAQGTVCEKQHNEGLVFCPKSPAAQIASNITGPIMFMDSIAVCKNPGVGAANKCYLTSAGQAWNTIHTLFTFGGAKRYLIPSASEAEVKLLGKVIQDYPGGLGFYTQERWRYDGAKNPATGRFSCQIYKSKYFPELERYAADPSISRAFAGFQFTDEPSILEVQGLQALRSCLQSSPIFRPKETFLNLFPLYAAKVDVMGTGSGTVSLADYNLYVSRMAREVKPSYLAVDFYPFDTTGNRDLEFATTLHTLSTHAHANNVIPVAYLQNAQSPTGAPMKRAFAAGLKWMASWTFAFGIEELSSWVSHDVLNKHGQTVYWGLMNAQNVARNLSSVDENLLGKFIQHIQPALKNYDFRRTIAPFVNLAIPKNGIVHSILGDQNNILFGEYVVPNTQKALIFFARRNASTVSTNQVTLQNWQKLELLNPATGKWQLISGGTNQIRLNISAEPGVLYRLTGDPNSPWRYK